MDLAKQMRWKKKGIIYLYNESIVEGRKYKL